MCACGSAVSLVREPGFQLPSLSRGVVWACPDDVTYLSLGPSKGLRRRVVRRISDPASLMAS